MDGSERKRMKSDGIGASYQREKESERERNDYYYERNT